MAFRSHHEHYEWTVMPFGLINAPSMFSKLMNHVFQKFLRKFVLVFFDGILVYSPSWDTHLQHLELVLQTLQKECLFARLSKYSFGSREIDYLGHTISVAGIAMDKAKVETVLDWPTSTNLKQLREFLGLTGYYRRFIKGYASITAPLTELLKKDAFKWRERLSIAFQHEAGYYFSPCTFSSGFLGAFHLEN